MKKKITVGYSSSGRILAGYSKMDSKNNKSFIGEKYDVTHEVMAVVAEKLRHDDEGIEWNLGDGRILRLQVDLYQATKPAHEKTGECSMNHISMFTCLNLTTPCAVTGKSGIPFFNPAMR